MNYEEILTEFETEIIEDLVDKYIVRDNGDFNYDDEFIYTYVSVQDKDSEDFYNISTAMHLETHYVEAEIYKNGVLQNES